MRCGRTVCSAPQLTSTWGFVKPATAAKAADMQMQLVQFSTYRKNSMSPRALQIYHSSPCLTSTKWQPSKCQLPRLLMSYCLTAGLANTSAYARSALCCRRSWNRLAMVHPTPRKPMKMDRVGSHGVVPECVCSQYWNEPLAPVSMQQFMGFIGYMRMHWIVLAETCPHPASDDHLDICLSTVMFGSAMRAHAGKPWHCKQPGAKPGLGCSCSPDAQMSPLQHRPHVPQVDIQLIPPMLREGLHPSQWQLCIPLVLSCSRLCNTLPCQHTCCSNALVTSCTPLPYRRALTCAIAVTHSSVTMPFPEDVLQGMCLHISVVV